jgi:hypothetical protein
MLRANYFVVVVYRESGEGGGSIPAAAAAACAHPGGEADEPGCACDPGAGLEVARPGRHAPRGGHRHRRTA